MTRRYCLALDLKNDPALIAEYERYHERIWPEITRSIRESGIEEMEIYRTGNRLFLVMEVSEDFRITAMRMRQSASSRQATIRPDCSGALTSTTRQYAPVVSS